MEKKVWGIVLIVVAVGAILGATLWTLSDNTFFVSPPAAICHLIPLLSTESQVILLNYFKNFFAALLV